MTFFPTKTWVVCGECLLPHTPLFCQVENLLHGCLQLFLQEAVPVAASCCNVLPDLWADVQSAHVELADIFVSQLGVAFGSLAGCSFPIEDVLGDLTIFHMMHSLPCLRSVYMLGMLVWARIRALDTKSLQLMPRMLRRHHVWKLFSFFSWLV